MRSKYAALLAVLTLAAALAVLAGCAKKAAQAPPTPPPAPAAPSTPPPAPEPPPTPAPTPQPEPAAQAEDVKPVFYDFDSYALTEQGRAVLDANAKYLRDHASASVVIEGHCDERGTVEYNQALGERRAQAAREYLVNAGIPAARLSVISYGKERPFDNGHDESAWAQNRRAHFVLK